VVVCWLDVPSSTMKYVWLAALLARPRTFHLWPLWLERTCLPLRCLLTWYAPSEPYVMSSCIAVLQRNFMQMKSSTPVRACVRGCRVVQRGCNGSAMGVQRGAMGVQRGCERCTYGREHRCAREVHLQQRPRLCMHDRLAVAEPQLGVGVARSAEQLVKVIGLQVEDARRDGQLRWQAGCVVLENDVEHLRGGCAVVAGWLRGGCGVVAGWLRGGCRVATVRIRLGIAAVGW
jgi:hypothetical protein